MSGSGGLMEILSLLRCFLTAEVLVELWVIATPPVAVNGLGRAVEQTRSIIDQLLNRFPLLEESPHIFPNWLELVTVNKLISKRTHDVRIVATMLAHETTYLLTFNPSDFAVTSDITIVQPEDLAISKADEP